MLLPHDLGISQGFLCCLVAGVGIGVFLQRHDIQLVIFAVHVGGSFYAKSTYPFGRILQIFFSRLITLIPAGHDSDSGVVLLLLKNDTDEDMRMDQEEALVRVEHLRGLAAVASEPIGECRG